MEVEGMFLCSMVDGIGFVKQTQIMSQFPTWEQLQHAGREKLLRIPALTSRDVENLLFYLNSPEKLQELWHRMKAQGIGYVSREQEAYPENLRQLADAPCGLFYRGKLPPAHKKKVAIVGARMCSAYGKTYAAKIAEALVKAGAVVISGMARGIDGIAQKKAAQMGGETFGVLAGGVDVIYPPEHRQLYEEILVHGGILSEYPPGKAPMKGMFPMRNRLISGVSDALIIIEAREKSGSLITGDMALEQGKDIFVLPGRINDPLSVGCNRYIKQGAQVITSIPELLSELGLTGEGTAEETIKRNFTLEKEDSLVYSCLRLVPRGVEELMTESGLTLLPLLESLSRLVDMGLAEEIYKNQYSRSK